MGEKYVKWCEKHAIDVIIWGCVATFALIVMLPFYA